MITSWIARQPGDQLAQVLLADLLLVGTAA
jgi:hypothetical protein